MAKEMLFSVVCPTCEAKIGVHDKRLVGQLVQCPKCGSIVQLSPPEENAKSEDLSQKKEEKKETIVPPPVCPAPQPAPPKTTENDNNQPVIPPPAPAPKPKSVQVPPPASIPVPPPVSNSEPIDSESLMPEPMAPATINSSSSKSGKSLSRQLEFLTDKLPSWAPYLIIGIGGIAFITVLFIFFLGGSKKESNNNNQPVVKNTISKENSENKTDSVVNPSQNNEDKKDSDSSANKENDLTNKDSKNKSDKKNVDVNDNGDNSENITPENEKSEDSALSDDNLDNNEDSVLNNKTVEKAENIDDNNGETAEDSQPEDDSDNPFRDVEPDTEDNSEQNTSPINGSTENADEALIAQDDLTPDSISNNDSDPEDNSADDSNSNSDLSSIPGLNTKLKLISIREQKLSQCLQTFRELGALPVEVNWDSLRRNGVNADDKISWSGKDVTLKTALSEVLAQRGLMFKINDEEKIVFAPRVSVNARSDSSVNSGQGGSAMVKTQYSVSDLVGQSPEKTAALIKSIREFLCPGDWKEVGGTGTISASGGGSVMITQSQHNHWIIADFLDRLRLARRLAPLYNRDASLEPMSVRAQSALKRNVGINFQPSADLKTALSEIGQRINVNILLDEPSLKIAGISTQFPVTIDARELSLEETFNRINEETGLMYLAQTPNSFIVTTPDGMKSMMSVEFFPISDLVNIGLTPAVLMEQIVKFEPKSWKSQDAASFGLIDFDANSDCLIVRQSPQVLSKITELLTQLRARLKEKE